MNKFDKYRFYLNMQHDWKSINCLTLIEDIYKNQLGIDFSDIWERVDRNDGVTEVNKMWYRCYGMPHLMNEIQHWHKVPLVELQEFDVLVFVRRNFPRHFGMYIDNNHFIHVEEDSYVNISLLDDAYRDMLYNKEGYRHERMVEKI